MYDAITDGHSVHTHGHTPNRFAVIPTAEKLRADLRFTGKGVRIAFLDSGFYPHPDIADSVVAFHDIHSEDRSFREISIASSHHWHGTQTAVSCAGNGSLSNGIYRGIAHESELVLVKVSQSGRITDESIEAGLEWIIANRECYDIRVLNISLGGDIEARTADSRINQLCEKLVESGVVLTVAAGNSSESCTKPPASAALVITVGGYSDENHIADDVRKIYHSSFGWTADGNVKPEIVAPAMYVAAPILPGTPDYDSAQILSMLAEAPDYSLSPLLAEFWQEAGLDRVVTDADVDDARRTIAEALNHRNLISAHYKHVDGTSFAAPIAASVVAQMLEANPRLSPAAVKNILVTTANRISSERAIRQGYGVIDARRAVELAASERHYFDSRGFGAPVREGEYVTFTFHDDRAQRVNLVGDLNDWDPSRHALSREPSGLWSIRVHLPDQITLRYKLLIDGERWIEDPSHGTKEEDGFGGFHSLLEI